MQLFDSISTWRDEIFDRLCEIWTQTKAAPDWQKDIWRKANTLQAVAYYWHSSTDPIQKRKAMDLMLDGYEFYTGFLKRSNNIWVDDFGWWAGFFCDLRKYTSSYPLAPPFDQTGLLNATEYCFERMMKNLDANKGGIWNELGREKNTVTNAWMLNVESDLFEITKDLNYKTLASAQYKWLNTGVYNVYSPPDWALYRDAEPGEGTLLWLLGPSDVRRESNWAGNEGVFLRGLSAYVNSVDSGRQKELATIGKNLIAAALRAYPDEQNVMHESAFSDDWSNDLATGKGVFMRLVTRFVIEHNFFGDQQFKATITQFVNATAAAVWRNRNAVNNTTLANWNPGFGPPEESQQPTTGQLWPQVWQTDGLDALNAAFQFAAAS